MELTPARRFDRWRALPFKLSPSGKHGPGFRPGTQGAFSGNPERPALARGAGAPAHLRGVTFPTAPRHTLHPADKVLVELAREHPRQVTVICLGPLTTLGNVAVAAVALAVLGFAVLELVGLRRLREA